MGLDVCIRSCSSGPIFGVSLIATSAGSIGVMCNVEVTRNLLCEKLSIDEAPFQRLRRDSARFLELQTSFQRFDMRRPIWLVARLNSDTIRKGTGAYLKEEGNPVMI